MSNAKTVTTPVQKIKPKPRFWAKKFTKGKKESPWPNNNPQYPNATETNPNIYNNI